MGAECVDTTAFASEGDVCAESSDQLSRPLLGAAGYHLFLDIILQGGGIDGVLLVEMPPQVLVHPEDV
jgi:hypothetical protein